MQTRLFITVFISWGLPVHTTVEYSLIPLSEQAKDIPGTVSYLIEKEERKNLENGAMPVTMIYVSLLPVITPEAIKRENKNFD